MEDLTLYQISNKFMELATIPEEEITEEQRAELNEALMNALCQKSNNIVGFIRNREALQDALAEEIDRLTQNKKRLEKQIQNFKEYVKVNMETIGIEKIETPLGSLTIAKNPISVEIIDEDQIPTEYKEIVTTIKVNKKKIADDFKATGELIGGVRIHTNNKSLRIK